MICHGFNNYCESPKFIGDRRVIFRTAVIFKKRDPYDRWDVYDDLFWRLITEIVSVVADEICIKLMDKTAPTCGTLSELRTWQSRQKLLDTEFVLEPPGEIVMFDKGSPVCLMWFEDWSDVVIHEPYACSFTFSFYSDNRLLNDRIGEIIRQFLLADIEISDITTVRESPTYKWYWPLLNVIKGELFFIYVGMVIFVLFVLIMLIVSTF